MQADGYLSHRDGTLVPSCWDKNPIGEGKSSHEGGTVTFCSIFAPYDSE